MYMTEDRKNLYNGLLFTPVTVDDADTLNQPHFVLYNRDVKINAELGDFYEESLIHVAGDSLNRRVSERVLSTPGVPSEYVGVSLDVPHFFPIITVLIDLVKEGESYSEGNYFTACHVHRANKRDLIQVTSINLPTKSFNYYTILSEYNIIVGFQEDTLQVHLYYKANSKSLYPKKIKVLL